jgi:hypothetical protein
MANVHVGMCHVIKQMLQVMDWQLMMVTMALLSRST